MKHILFPVDLSEQAVLAAPFVRAIASRCEARITLLSVVPPVWDDPLLKLPPRVEIDVEAWERDLKSHLGEVFTKEFAGLCVQTTTDHGDPALKITEYAASHAVDLIMMPTHGCGLFRSLLIGSVTAKVLHDAHCPIWTARHSEEQRSGGLPKTILCAVDDSPKAPMLMQWAAEFSKRIGATLRLLHVVTPISDWLALRSERELQEQVCEQARLKINSLQGSAGLELPLRVAVGRVAGTVTAEARQSGSDLIVIGRGSLQLSLGRLLTHVYGIIQESPCPVVSV